MNHTCASFGGFCLSCILNPCEIRKEWLRNEKEQKNSQEAK